MKDCGHQLQECKKRPFVDLNEIVGSLKRRDLVPALRWCENNRAALKMRCVAASCCHSLVTARVVSSNFKMCSYDCSYQFGGNLRVTRFAAAKLTV